jgi:hypothetical protein
MTRLQAIQERHSASTRGDWRVAHSVEDAADWWSSTEPECVVVCGDGDATIHICCTNDDGIATVQEIADAAYLAASHQDVPWLLARVEQMRSVIASEVAMCFGCHGSGCDSCKALCDALSALDEEVPETVQS